MSVVLRVEGLTKCYGSIVAVDGVSAEIGEGELVSFVGPSGCGKTTLLRMIGGFIRADAGRVVLDGHDVTDEPPNRRSTAMVFQSYALFPHLSVADNVGYALRVHRCCCCIAVNRLHGRGYELCQADAGYLPTRLEC